ncbi:MAG TPA: DAK2 domain-containing protein [Candidatus Limnocylindrales bacterium]|nr:DAK2 domain-containing protein [Candidatus Limnocylindrales bacterium]
MRSESWDGEELLSAVRHAARVLANHQEEVNALNVFPVPDGDTGSNMVATVQAAVAEAEQIPVANRSVPNVGAAMRLGALMGARGNSGVILSQIFRGMAEVVTSVERVTGVELARAFDHGCRAAFAAVAQPVEGTILTVARDVSTAAEPVARDHGDIERVLAASVAAAAASVERTPQLLPILEHAGVVDAGGRGLELLLRGALEYTRGEELRSPAPLHDIVLPSLEAIEADGYGYETVFLITPHSGTRLDTVAISNRLSHLGASVLVAGDERAAKIHIHNDRPDEVIAYGLSLGGLSRIAVENLDRQARGVRDRVEEAAATVFPQYSAVPATPEGPQVIAVVSGDGLARIFRTLGARAVVLGGQSANPSAGELADAVAASGASEVIVLPNNPNVRMAARQAADLCPNVRVEIVPTRNAAEGIAAMLALDTSDDVRAAADKMSAAAGRIQSMQVAVAVRHARVGRRRVRHGDFIVLGPSDGLMATDSDRTAAVLAAAHRLKPGYELMTVYRGQNVPHPDAEQLGEALRAELDGVEIELVDGGQPHYDFLISAE